MALWKDDIIEYALRVPWSRRQAPGPRLGAKIQYARAITLRHGYQKDVGPGSVFAMGIFFTVANRR